MKPRHGMLELIQQVLYIPSRGTPGRATYRADSRPVIIGHDRGERNDPLVALAVFIAGTITQGCGCDSCDDRREIVMQLVYGTGVDEACLHNTIFDAPLPKKQKRKRSPNGTRIGKSKKPKWKGKV